MFDDFVVHSYTSEQAIEDGYLCHPYPARFPWLLITEGIHAACIEEKASDLRTYDQKLIPLIMDAVMLVRSLQDPEPPLVLEHTVAGTVWIMPNEKGGMTLMLPSEY